MQNTGTIGNQNTGSQSNPTEKTLTDVKTIDINDKRDLDHLTVVKRNGMIVPFRKSRIRAAIEASFRDTYSVPTSDPLSVEHHKAVQDITNEVTQAIVDQAGTDGCLDVESIQDLVEMKLLEGDFHEVGRKYIVYREERKTLREDSPRNLRITRRDGREVRFKPLKIAQAIESAFRATRKIEGSTPQEVVDAVNSLTNRVVTSAADLTKEGTQLGVELIQDEVEKALMAEGFYPEAKDFIIYRAKRAALREVEEVPAAPTPEVAEPAIDRRQIVIESVDPGRTFTTNLDDGTTGTVTERDLLKTITHACKGYEELVQPEKILENSIRNFYDGITPAEVDKANIMASKAMIEKEPAYSSVSGGILLDVIYREVLGIEAADPQLETAHREYFKQYIYRGAELDRLSPELQTYDLDRLAQAMDLNRDRLFTYLGVQTIYDRYLIHEKDIKIETPQIFWMRVSMGLALQEDDKNAKAIEFYDVLSQFYFMSSTPTLFNSGTTHSQMSSCYLSTVMDDLSHIFKVISDDAQLSKWAGGLGNDWTNVRATGSRIKGTNGKSQGVIPFLKVANDTAVAVNQGGKRKGAMCAYLETWHLDIEDFLELRKNTGDERRRTHDMNTANWIPDLFMKRVTNNESWTLFSPSDVSDLHDLYGKEFEERYAEYERMAESGEISLFKKVEAVQLWRKMLSMLFETGHPWITFKDPSNIRSPQDHAGVVHSSNLCTEILLNTSADETAVCNLGSVNLAKHTTESGIDMGRLQQTIKTAIRMLDNVIDLNFYPTDEARNSNLKHRPIGLGMMGFQDALYLRGISYASPEAVDFADESMEAIAYYAIQASCGLAEERGTYQSYKGSKWDRGMLPIDTLNLLSEERGAEWVDIDTSYQLDWEALRAKIQEFGVRNSNTMAIAPTATISNITGVIQSIEPSYKHLYAKSNLSGEFIIQNTYLVDELKKLNIWDEDMIDDLKYFDGSILEIERIPEDLKRVYLTAFEIEPEWLIECAARRQKWIDMGQSLNLYMAEPSGKALHNMYMMAWKRGLKTTYYLRSLGATQIEKSTTDINKRGLQPRWMKNKSASADISVDREAQAVAEAEKTDAAMPGTSCNLDGDCESCQ